MRILFASHYALPHIGGIEAVIGALGNELRRRGHEVVHIASTAGGRGEPGDGVIRVPAWNWPERELGVPWPLFGPQLVPAVRREVGKADVVHAHGALYMSAVGALLAARRGPRGRPAPARVLTEHVGHVPYDSAALDKVQQAAFGTVGRLAVRSAQAVVVLNEKVESEMRALARPGAEVLTIRNGVDSATYRPPEAGERDQLRAELGWDDDRPRVLFVGRPVAKKGADVAVATAAAAHGAFDLVHAGPGELTGPNVLSLGPQTPAQIAQLYRAGDAFLLPSYGEGFPVTAQEAMASGLPVLLSDDPSYGPWVEGAGAGVTLVQRKPEAILEALKPLLASLEACERAGAAAREHAVRHFSWSHVADEHEALYERLRAGNR